MKENPEEPTEPAEVRRPFLHRLAIPIGFLVGAGITAGSTYALVARVQHQIENASVDNDPAKWASAARKQAYDACYYGCIDCNDPSYAYNACQMTARAEVQGVLCDGTKMWNWAAKDRYPEQCLAAVGRILMGEQLERVKQSYRNQLGIIALTVLAGIVGGVLTYILWRRVTMSKVQREAARARNRNRPFSVLHPGTWGPQLRRGGGSGARNRTVRLNLKSLLTTVAAVFGAAKPAKGYACTGRAPAWNQYFVSANSSAPTISGVVHGWFSNCISNRVCSQVCSPRCNTNSNGITHCSQHCHTSCHTETYTDRQPKDYVDKVAPRVRDCGFSLVDALPTGVTAAERVGNPALERDLWVKISVSGFNVTRSDATDDRVWCLYRIGG
ncbi:hypothetical protein N656DRAFT_782909 [Canariomyces notabilis]|uniref:Uncharacterized protein n=1 Tax=Canariomyces notabilis TaxID=2074819 RepID=A0AAN6QGE5_9PEZI|nr:hypothetical protein N656DRAFT_782909 [Canariomyces arenarius]